MLLTSMTALRSGSCITLNLRPAFTTSTPSPGSTWLKTSWLTTKLISSILADGGFGYISLDFKKRFLSATDVARKFFPEIANNHADRYIEDEKLRKIIEEWVDDFKKKQTPQNHIYKNGDSVYMIHVSYLYDGKKKRGYLLEITDDTKNHPELEPAEN